MRTSQIRNFDDYNSTLTRQSEDQRDQAKFKKIMLSVSIFALLVFMADLDPSLKRRSPKFVTKGEQTVERKEPSFLTKTFCRGNQRPSFCLN